MTLLRTISAEDEIRHFHLFCGSGGGAIGFNRGEARVGAMKAKPVCLGGVDNHPGRIREFTRLAGVPGTLLDMFSRDQYVAFHGREPPSEWREARPDDIRRAAGGRFPNVVFFSAPCKGFSGLLPEQSSKTARYQALNDLTIRALWLMLEAFGDDPPEFLIFENVPRIMTRGRPMLDQMHALSRSWNYIARESKHDCGELGWLPQSRKRFLMVMRHATKVPSFLYEPPKRPLRGVGEVLGRMALPGDPAAGPMHRMPRLQWQTWVRLAMVEAGSDWRSLNKLRVVDGFLADHGIIPETTFRTAYGVHRWGDVANTITGDARPSKGGFSVADPRMAENNFHAYGVLRGTDPAGTVTAQSRSGTGVFAVADPRVDGHAKSVQLGVRGWTSPAPVIKGDVSVGTGPYAVADPRVGQTGPRFNNVYRVVRFDEAAKAVSGGDGKTQAVADPRAGSAFEGRGKYRVVRGDEAAGTVIAESHTGNGAYAVADPRTGPLFKGAYGVVDGAAPVGTVMGESFPSNGAFAVADPRPAFTKGNRDVFQSQPYYGVLPWEQRAGAVTASAQHDNGAWSVADPRETEGAALAETLPQPGARLVAVIRALDDTWHRPFTTLELAALQGLYDPDDDHELVLDGTSDSDWREAIGNLVPPPAAQAIASEIYRTILLSRAGETFKLSATPIWVRPLVIAIAVDGGAPL